MSTAELEATIRQLAAPGKGILAADESTGTIEKRLAAVGVASTEQTRRDYRELLFTTPGLGEFISGVILFDETLRQTARDGTPFPEVLQRQGMVPGIKVDKGTVPLPGFAGEKITQGLDGLAERLTEYKGLGARFAKWRAVISIGEGRPSAPAIAANAHALARYAGECQAQGIVPIVEPEVLLDGKHGIEECQQVSERVLHQVFHALYRLRVSLEHMVLKPSMVLPGTDSGQRASPETIAQATLTCFRRTVPAAVASINFLSGGQTPEEATANLNALNTAPLPHPWPLSFSYARALQEPALRAWAGDADNAVTAQHALYRRARFNSIAREGEYEAAMEHED